MIRYYPKNKITPNLYSNGTSLTLNGKPYFGYYYETFDGKFFTGASPEKGLNDILLPVSQPSSNKTQVNITNNTQNTKQSQYNFNKPTSVEDDINSVFDFTNKFVPYYPSPTTYDYTKGYIIRYFSKSVGHNDSIIEISKKQFESFKTNSNKQDILKYQVIDIFWQISGPLRTKDGVAGIIDTNKRIVENREIEFAGLKNYIGNQYDKFSIPKK